MGQTLILEVVDPRGRIRHRLRLDAAPVTIGRSYRNDLILDDPYVDAHHLRIEPTEGGDWVVTDLGSKNGTWEARGGSGGRRITSQLLQATNELRIGRTVLRALSPDQPMPAALIDPAHQAGPLNRLAHPLAALPICGAAVAVSAGAQFLASTSEQGFVELATPGLTILMVATIWASAWAFTNRLVAHRFRFLGHLGWAMLLATAFALASTGFEWIGFFAPAIAWGWLEVLVGGGLFSLLLVGHFQLITEWPLGKQWRIAGVSTALLIGIGAVLSQSNVFNDSEARDVASIPLKPISARLVPTASMDQFFRKTRTLQKIVDDLAGDPVSK